jgi:bifunctional UDP-N-acetylglucosamine pyrophosphorylase/glucosamine-1-phosphate N-acetyltransferase
VPKILEPIHGTPMVVHPIRTALEAGITDIVVVVNDLFGRDIRKAIRMHGPVCEPEFVVQPDRYGSANAVLRALPHFRRKRVETALVMYADMPFWSPESMRRLISAHLMGAVVTMMIAERESFPHIDAYGRVLRDTVGSVRSIVEVDTATQEEESGAEVNPSFWVWDTEWLEKSIPKVEPILGKTAGQPEQHLPPLIEIAYREHRRINEVQLPALRHYEALGINTLAELERARSWWDAA